MRETSTVRPKFSAMRTRPGQARGTRIIRGRGYWSGIVGLGVTLLASPFASAIQVAFATTGVYDETATSRNVAVGGSLQSGVINNVDFNAAFASGTGGATAANITTASAGNGASYTTTGPFNSAVAAAFGRNRGGVIAFDNMTTGSYGPTNAFTYGTAQGKGISIGFGGTYSVSNGVVDASTSISGQNYITHPLTHGYDITFGAMNNSSVGETGVIQAGLTLISEDGGTAIDFGLVSATATFSGGGTVTSSRTINNLNTQGDTFYGFVAPTGQTISEITVTSTNDAPDLDDLAFTTEVPEPSSLATLLFAAAPLWGRRRRR